MPSGTRCECHLAASARPVPCCRACDRRRFLRSRCSPRRSAACRRRSSRARRSRRPCSCACTTTRCCWRGGRCIRTIRGRGTSGCRAGAGSAGDESLLATALRETQEELGIDPLAHGRLLGALGTHIGRGRRVTGVRIAVFVAALDERPPLELSAELDAAHWVPLSELVPVPVRVAELPDTDVPAYAIALPDGDQHGRLGDHVLDPRAPARAARGLLPSPARPRTAAARRAPGRHCAMR